MTNKFRAEVDASEFGPGFTIRLDVEGQAIIETADGTKPAQIGQAILDMQNGLALLSSHYIKSFLSVALRKDDVVVDAVPDIPPPLDVIGRKCLDVFTLFRYGKDAETWAADNDKAEKKAAPVNPTKGTKA